MICIKAHVIHGLSTLPYPQQVAAVVEESFKPLKIYGLTTPARLTPFRLG